MKGIRKRRVLMQLSLTKRTYIYPNVVTNVPTPHAKQEHSLKTFFNQTQQSLVLLVALVEVASRQHVYVFCCADL